jgi:hypothetical protein
MHMEELSPAELKTLLSADHYGRLHTDQKDMLVELEKRGLVVCMEKYETRPYYLTDEGKALWEKYPHK